LPELTKSSKERRKSKEDMFGDEKFKGSIRND